MNLLLKFSVCLKAWSKTPINFAIHINLSPILPTSYFLLRSSYFFSTNPINSTATQSATIEIIFLRLIIDRKQIFDLLSPRFEILKIESIIDGYGSTGIFRIVNSYKLNQLLQYVRL